MSKFKVVGVPPQDTIEISLFRQLIEDWPLDKQNDALGLFVYMVGRLEVLERRLDATEAALYTATLNNR